jgi:hypothetical protein
VCIFKCLIGYTYGGGYKTKSVCYNNNNNNNNNSSSSSNNNNNNNNNGPRGMGEVAPLYGVDSTG